MIALKPLPFFLKKPTCSKYHAAYISSPENLQKDFIGLSLSGENGEEVGFDEENEEYQYEKTPVGNEIEI